MRAAQVQHWSLVALRTRPPDLPEIVRQERTDLSAREVFSQCDKLLRALLHRRRRRLRLTPSDIAHVIHGYDLAHFAASGKDTVLAYLLAWMHWRGYSLPPFLLRPPLHPPTGLERWLASHDVFEQVDNGQQVLQQLVHEERRIFEHALAIVGSLLRHAPNHAGGAIVLLPELLSIQERTKNSARSQDYGSSALCVTPMRRHAG